MPALKIFLFIPQHFSWQEVDNEKVHNKPTALTLVITRRLKGISVCLSVLHMSSGPPWPALYCGQLTMPYSLDLCVLTVFLRSTFFKGRKLVFLYLLWMGYFLPICNSLEMLFRNQDEEEKNKSFFQPRISLKEEAWVKASHQGQEGNTISHLFHPFMKQEVGEQGVIPNLASGQ